MTTPLRALALSALLSFAQAAPVLAQGLPYPAQPAPLPPGHGGPYGWSWGWAWGPAGSTVPGDVLGNAGRYLGGLGSYEAQAAWAEAVRGEELRRQAVSESLGSADQFRRYNRNVARRRERLIETQEAIVRARLERPTARDVHSGDTPNRLLSELSPLLSGLRALPSAGQKLDAGLVAGLPLHCPAAMTTVRLRDLRPGPQYDRLRSRAFDYQPARLAVFRRELARGGGVTLEELIGFMRTFGLRFAPAETVADRAAYEELHALLSQLLRESRGGLALRSDAAAG